MLYKQGKLTPEASGDECLGRVHWGEYPYTAGHYCSGWYPLDPAATVKFCFAHGD